MTVDPRTIQDQLVGTPLRDAAVSPAAGDFLPPVNAGLEGEEGNPHGPTVVAPGIHAGDTIRPVRPGAVSDDPAVQGTEETTHLSDHTGIQPVPDEPEEPAP